MTTDERIGAIWISMAVSRGCWKPRAPIAPPDAKIDRDRQTSRLRFHKFHVEIDGDLISDRNSTGLQRRIPCQSKIFSADDGARRGRHPNVAPRIFGGGRNAVDVELDIASDAVNG